MVGVVIAPGFNGPVHRNMCVWVRLVRVCCPGVNERSRCGRRGEGRSSPLQERRRRRTGTDKVRSPILPPLFFTLFSCCCPLYTSLYITITIIHSPTIRPLWRYVTRSENTIYAYLYERVYRAIHPNGGGYTRKVVPLFLKILLRNCIIIYFFYGNARFLYHIVRSRMFFGRVVAVWVIVEYLRWAEWYHYYSLVLTSNNFDSYSCFETGK